MAELRELYPRVQLATLVDTVPKGSNWVHKIKFDGYRLPWSPRRTLGAVDNAQREQLDRLHIAVRITAKDSWSTVKRFAAGVADEMVAAAPRLMSPR
jgi:hypothetical protein